MLPWQLCIWFYKVFLFWIIKYKSLIHYKYDIMVYLYQFTKSAKNDFKIAKKVKLG